MTIEKVTSLGNINITEEAIATLAGQVVSECYGIVGMASKKIVQDSISMLLKKENYGKGIVVNRTTKGIEINIYVIVSCGVRISEVVYEAQKKIKYVLENTLQQELGAVNVFVQGVAKKD